MCECCTHVDTLHLEVVGCWSCSYYFIVLRVSALHGIRPRCHSFGPRPMAQSYDHEADDMVDFQACPRTMKEREGDSGTADDEPIRLTKEIVRERVVSELGRMAAPSGLSLRSG